MLDIAGIFKNRALDPSRLMEYGFARADGQYTISYEILDGQFQMNIIIISAGSVYVHVIDTDSQEEYILIHTPEACGAFVGAVIQACEEKLKIIAENCFDYTVFKSEQVKQIIAYAGETYRSNLEFLWKKSPNNAVFRRRDGGKWYAAILTVGEEKLGLAGTETIEIIDLRGLPDEIERLVDGKNYFPGYHMNKKHWYTICLDASVSTQEICERIETSYLLAKK